MLIAQRWLSVSIKIIFILIIVLTILSGCGVLPVPEYQPLSLANYDLTGDGWVTVADLDKYRELFNAGLLDGLDFNGDGVVDIYDQTLLAYNVIEIQEIYFPIILRG